MSERNGGVTAPAKTARLVELIVDGLSVTEAAKEIGVSRRHAYRLISDPEAKAAIQRAARESAKSAQLVLQRGAEEAARSLVDMARGKAKATPARVAAARGVLDFVIEKAATQLNVAATRVANVPEAFVAGAVGVLERALADEDRATDDETVAPPSEADGTRVLEASTVEPGPTVGPSAPEPAPPLNARLPRGAEEGSST